MSEYVLQTGAEGADRLRLLARVKWPGTEALLRRAGLAEGMRCLDLGCGIGTVTLELARLVGPTGHATGVDVDEGFLALARHEAQRLGLPASFQKASADAFPANAHWDLAYARFLLTHLPRPEEALTRMKQAVQPGGVVIIEDIDCGGHFCYPPCKAYQRYVELYSAVVRHNGGDPNIGPRLLGMFEHAGLVQIQMEVVMPTFYEGEGKRVSLVTLAHIRPAVLKAGLATAADLDATVAELQAFTDEPQTILSLPRIFQVWGRRPVPRSRAPGT